MATTIATLLIKLEAETTNVQKGFTNVQKAAVALGAAVVAASKVSLDLFDKQDKAEKSLLTALKGRETVQKRLLAQASEFQKVSLFGDEQIIQQQAFLASLQLTEKEINGVTAAAIDLAAGTGVTLESAVKNLAKTYSGLTGELGESIPQLRELTTEELKAGKAIDVVAEAFRGQAQAAAEAGTGPLVQMQNALGDVAEIVGEALAPAVKEAANLIKDWASDLTQYSETGGFKKIQAALVAGVEAIRVWVEGVRASVGPLLAAVNAAEALAAAIKLDFTTAAEKGKKAWDELKKPVEQFLSIGDNIERVSKAYSDALEKITTAAAGEGGNGQGGAAGALDKLNEKQEEQAVRIKLTNRELEEQLKLLARLNEGPQNVQSIIPIVNTEGVSGQRDISGPSAADPENVAAMKDEIYRLADAYGVLNEQLISYIEGIQTTTNLTETLNTLNSSWYQGILEVGDALTQYSQQGGASLKEFANIALKTSRQVIGSMIREGIAALIRNAFISSGNPLVGLALAPVAGALGETLFNSILKGLKIPAFGDGGLVTGPTLALVGEKGPELITPLSKLGNGPLEVRVVGEIEGNKLKLISDRYDQIGERKFT